MTDKKTSGYDPENYTDDAKRKRFIKVVERRMDRLLNDLRLLGNTSNKSLYNYDQTDVEKVFKEIDNKVAEIKSKFNSGKTHKPFRLED